MYTTKPHFYVGISHNLLKIRVQFPEKLLPALRIREIKYTFAAKTQRKILQIQKNPAYSATKVGFSKEKKCIFKGVHKGAF